MLVGRLDAFGVHDASTRGSKVLDTTLPRPVNVVGEGEEGVAGACNAVKGRGPLLLLSSSERLRDSLKKTLPVRLLRALEDLTADVEIDSVGLLSTLDALLEGESKDLGMVTEPPEIGLSTSQTGAVDAGLLACTDADNSTMVSIGDTVGLCVLEGKGGDDEVCDGLLREILVLGDYVLEELRIDFGVVAGLLEGDAVDLLGLNGRRNVGGIDL